MTTTFPEMSKIFLTATPPLAAGIVRDTGGPGAKLPPLDARGNQAPGPPRFSMQHCAGDQLRHVVEATGIEPATPCLQSRSSTN